MRRILLTLSRFLRFRARLRALWQGRGALYPWGSWRHFEECAGRILLSEFCRDVLESRLASFAYRAKRRRIAIFDFARAGRSLEGVSVCIGLFVGSSELRSGAALKKGTFFFGERPCKYRLCLRGGGERKILRIFYPFCRTAWPLRFFCPREFALNIAPH